tara:strand:+ start:693 stop:1124 length:432 start_codon:yes stop_codon:yes gene_type:complete
MFKNKKNKKCHRVVWDKYDLMWNIAGNYSCNEFYINKNKPERAVLQRTIKLIQEVPRLDEVLRLRQDWIVLDKKGFTDISKTKQNVKDALIDIKEKIEAYEYDASFLDTYIQNGFEHLQTPKRLSKLKAIQLSFDNLGLSKKT